MRRILFFLFFTTLSFSQTRTIIGVVSDDSNIPLESANVIAKPLQDKASLKFAIADNKGRYRLELEKEVKYEITVSYIGFVEEVFILEADATIATHDFKLKPTGEQLKEIVIKHEFKPIVIKKDTMTFDVKSFANGNERKMKEILEKLPGVEVDKNGGVTVQGKKVTKMLVEGKSFFGGGSKLAVENIPADALDKIEVIDHFNEVGFMKQVSDSDELAINVKLKADKKKFVFGDVEAGAEVGNADNGFYLGHAALFYYSPKSNVSFIGDLNNIGKRTFTFDDLMRFGGGMSTFLSGRKSLTNLYSFANDNQDVVQNTSQFGAVNFSHDTSSKLSISGFSIFSKVLTASQTESRNEYLQNTAFAFENKLQNGDNRSVLGIGNIKLDYSPNAKEKWYYNGQYQSSTNAMSNTINSITNLNSSVFETINKADNTAVKQYVEWHKSYSLAHTTTLVVNQAYDYNTPQTNWFTDQPFLDGLIPLQDDTSYRIEQIKKVKTNSVDALFKHYWIIDNFNHLYTNVGNNYGASRFETSEKQLLTNGTINDFALNGFGNAVKYQLNDAYVGLEYKFRIGKWTNKPGLYLHWYHLITQQNSGNQSLAKTLFQPQWNSEYEFNKSETLNFTYKLENGFPQVSQLADQFTLQNYNLVYKGNALLQNERYHSANLRYSKMNLYRGVTWNAMASVNKKVQTIRDEILLDGINQFNTPILSDNPETNYNVNGAFTKKIYRFSLRFNTSLSWFNYFQTLNNTETLNNRKNQRVGVVLKTAHKKWPGFSVGYTKGFSQFSGLTKSNFQTDAVTSDFDINFSKFWTYKLSYENLKNTNNNNQSNFYDIANTSLRYQKKNSPFGFEVLVNNLFDNKVKNDYSFSDYLISERTTFVLPRVFLFSVSYKL
ncbi:TonB-dependent receptor [Flavobacterium xanthum]|uniref:Carboxypeptidase regulatory-like domain-containing protein n=1 Tax=Flavobacterium xanthum TaxID=69322 RepID=A0A1M7AZG1_9FLAO|nr:TonB-dependent receptor [Flavobacterium xanthum]SHL48140.1 Carboxypeptidase regulatory-like domain-containing protein [Flavobacterium xanthum]